MNGLPPGFELDEEPAGMEAFGQKAAPYMQQLQADFGLTPDQAAGIMGNLGHESAGLQAGIQERNPTAGRGGLGWAQWTGPRRRAFEQYLASTGQAAHDPGANYGYLKAELTGQIPGHDYSRVLDDVRQAGNADDAMLRFERGYERAGVKHYDSRSKYARAALGSSQHVASMRERYAPNLFQRAAGGVFDALVPPAQAADQPPPGNGVMLPAGFEIDQTPTPGGLPPGFELDDAPQASTIAPSWQTAIRSTVKGLSAPLTLAADAVNAPVNLIAKGVNALRPGTMGYLPPTGAYVDQALQAGGIDPRPASNAERAVTAGLSAATGAGLSGAASLPAFAAAPGKQVLGAMSASGASDIAREAGAPVPVQIGAGIVGGMLPGVGQGVMNAVGNTAGRLAAPFTRGGKEAIAGRVLNKQAAAPNTALARAGSPDFNTQGIPGSAPTLAEVTQDPGLARLQRVLPSSQAAIDAGVEQVNAARITQMDKAIRDTLDRVNKAPKTGGADVLDTIGRIKQRIGKTFGDQLAARGIDPADLAVPTTSLENKLAELARKHQGNAKLEKLIQATQAGIEGGTNFTRLWNNRQSLDDLIYENLLTATAGSKADMKRLGQDIRSAMNDDLIAAVPEFKPFLDRYSRMARAEGRLKLGRDLVAKSENTARNIADEAQVYGDRTFSGAKLDRLDIPGAERRAGAKLSKAQREAFAAAQEEKRRAAILTGGGAPINSATAQNLAVNQILSDDILGGLMGDNTRTGLAGFARNILQSVPGRVADAATRPAQVDVMRMIQRGLIDPEEGARLMRLGRLRETQALMPALESGARSGILSEIYSQMGRR